MAIRIILLAILVITILSTTTVTLALELDDDHEIITKGCFGGGYHKDRPKICFPIENGELEIEPPKDVSFCAALGCPYNPPDLSKE